MYPGLGMIESSNISVGRGTDTPFAWIGAPWDRRNPICSRALNHRMIPGIRFVPVEFTPQAAGIPMLARSAKGVQFVITKPQRAECT